MFTFVQTLKRITFKMFSLDTSMLHTKKAFLNKSLEGSEVNLVRGEGVEPSMGYPTGTSHV